MAARWRKHKRETGLASVCQAGIPLSSGLFAHGVSSEEVLTVSPLLCNNREVVGWYWYGMGQNTAHAPVESEAAAKAEAMEFYRRAQAEGE